MVDKKVKSVEDTPLRQQHYKDLRRKYLVRLSLTYMAPTIILMIFFVYQYITLNNENQKNHLMSIAEGQVRILDIFLKERVGNLLNLIDGPFMQKEPAKESMDFYLNELKRTSESFIDIGFFNSSGIQSNYAGPLKQLVNRDYSRETWFVDLIQLDKRYIITDIYLGLRGKPHFTIGVKRNIKNGYYILKSSLDPQKIYEYIISTEKSLDVNISIVNFRGKYQLVNKKMANLLDSCPISPRASKVNGFEETTLKGKSIKYAYSWLSETDWAVIVSLDTSHSSGFFIKYSNVIIASIFVLAILIIIIVFRSKVMVFNDYERDIAKSQLEQASKLATVGELSAGIAHEIGNPLNIIANEVGIMKDYTDPRFKVEKSIEDLQPHFEKIMKAVFRCKDINNKLLTFVRREGLNADYFDINVIIKELVSGFFERELSYENIKLKFSLKENLPKVYLDANQIRQVLINLINNAADAIGKGGEIAISTNLLSDKIVLSVSDTGKGIPHEEIDKIFLPFFTTKPVGKGTGLGLSVSYGIIKNHGGEIHVESVVGKGTSFIVELPIAVES
ncbi:MAG: ATP-binding protein [bacterium]